MESAPHGRTRSATVPLRALSDQAEGAPPPPHAFTRRRPAPAAHRRWGPEFWPPAVRENVEVWPPLFRDRQLVSTIRRPVDGPRRIAVISRKSGVGKTVTAQMLEAIFSSCREEPAVVLDATGATQPAGPPVAAIPDTELPVSGMWQWGGAAGAVMLTPPPSSTAYGALATQLAQNLPLVFIDCGSELGETAIREVLDNCDQIVVVATPALDGMYAATATLDWLRRHGYSRLADESVVALNRIRRMQFSDLLNVDRHFSRHCREVVRIRWDSRIGAEQPPMLDEIRPTTRTGFFELAAAVARSFGVSATSLHREEGS